MNVIQKLIAVVAEWLTGPDVLRAIAADLRALSPIATLGETVVVSTHADVLEVLRSPAFGVTEVYAAKMIRTTGAFFLGMEDTPQSRRETEVARRAVAKDDRSRIAAIVGDTSRALLAEARARGGSFDAVDDYARRIPLALVERYFGVPGPDLATMKRWMRDIFWDIFLNPNDDPGVRERAGHASAELAPYLRTLLDERRRREPSRAVEYDDFVSRLLEEQKSDASIDDDLVVRNIGGIIVGAVDTQSKVIAHVLDQLLRKPWAYETARRAALADDDVGVAAHVWEALRFNPHNPVIFRQCHADTAIADGTERRTPVLKGSRVIAFTLSAMFDPAVFERPDEFRVDRRASAYLHFGDGQHRCFGEGINRIVLPLALKPLLLLDNLRYAEDGPGAIAYEGPFPNSMKLRFDADT